MAILKTSGTWALTILLALFFLFVSYKKLTGNEITASHFQEWGYANWLLTFIGCLELTGAILLLFPLTATSGALLLSLIMVGASYTLLSHEVWRTLIVTTTCLVLLILLGYLRWNQSWILSVLKMNS
jgi:putative oxidoreductase